MNWISDQSQGIWNCTRKLGSNEYLDHSLLNCNGLPTSKSTYTFQYQYISIKSNVIHYSNEIWKVAIADPDPEPVAGWKKQWFNNWQPFNGLSFSNNVLLLLLLCINKCIINVELYIFCISFIPSCLIVFLLKIWST